MDSCDGNPRGMLQLYVSDFSDFMRLYMGSEVQDRFFRKSSHIPDIGFKYIQVYKRDRGFDL